MVGFRFNVLCKKTFHPTLESFLGEGGALLDEDLGVKQRVIIVRFVAIGA